MSKQDLDALKAAKAAAGKEVAKYNRWTKFLRLEPTGPTEFKILPSRNGSKVCFQEIDQHWIASKRKEGWMFPYRCSKKEHGSCPMCDKSDDLALLGVNSYEAEVSPARKVYLYNVLLPTGIIKILEANLTLHTLILDVMTKSFEGSGEDLASFECGKTILIRRNETSPRYSVTISTRAPKQLTLQQIEIVKSKLWDLDASHQKYTPDQLRMAIQGVDLKTGHFDSFVGAYNKTKSKKKFNGEFATVTNIRDHLRPSDSEHEAVANDLRNKLKD